MRAFHLDPEEGFSPEVGRFAAMLADTRRRLMRDLEGLIPEDLDRTPEWAPNSIGTLLYHVAAIELDWTFADIRETDVFPPGVEDWFPFDVRDQDGTLTPVSDPLDRHLARLEWVRGHLRSTLRDLSDDDLDRTVNPGAHESGIGFVLHHLMQHEAEHRGQINEIRAALSFE